MLKKEINPKKSQITIFIIIGLLLVSVIILFFLISGSSPREVLPQPEMPSPHQEVRKCVDENIEEAERIMLPQGGYINTSNYKLYKDMKIEYLCYTNQYYYTCVTQEPMYIQHLEKEIHDYAKPKIEECLSNLIQEYKNKNYEVSEDNLNLGIDLRPKQILVEMDKKVVMGRGEESVSLEEEEYIINSPLYNLAIIAQEIASQEAKFCNFEYIGYSLLYPEFSIEKDQVGSAETISDIYKIRDKNTNKTLNIAIRSCAMPGGL